MVTRLYSPALLVATILSLVLCASRNHAQASLECDHLDQLTLQITYTDGSTFDVDLHGTSLEESYGDAFTRCEVSLSSVDFGSEVHFSLSPLKPKPIKFVDLVFEYDDTFMTKDVVFYDNGFHTNYTPKIMKPSGHGHVSRELVLFKNKKSGEHLNIAFGSFKRFYTYFKTSKDKVIARNHMEDRPLKLGEVYNLEPIIFDDALPGDHFFEQYATLLGERKNVKLKPVPMGWSSWSIYYGTTTHDDVIKDAKILAEEYKPLGVEYVQLDGGWYKAWGDWHPNKNLFPKGIAGLSEEVRALDLTFANWFAHTLFRPNSELFKNNHDFNIFYDGKIKPSFGGKDEELIMDPAASYAIDLSNPEVQQFLYDTFKKAADEHHTKYFKLDFLIRSLVRSGHNNEAVIYYPNGDYATAEYNRAQQIVRDAVGPDTFLISCGAPVGESIGYFDAMRVDPDITQGKKLEDFWSMFRNNISCIFLKSYFHGRAILNDPDALIVRDYATDLDYVALSYDQAQTWATTVAMCGGSFIINEAMDKLTPEREELIKQLLPVYGKGAVPLDFFEQGGPSMVHIQVEDARTPATLATAFNLGDDVLTREFPLEQLGFKGDVIIIDCWSKEVLGGFKGTFTAEDMPAHSVKSLLIREVPETPAFLAADANFYLGVDRCEEDVFSAKDRTLRIVLDKSIRTEDENLYLYVPIDYEPKQSLTKVWSDAKGGVFKSQVGADGISEFVF